MVAAAWAMLPRLAERQAPPPDRHELSRARRAFGYAPGDGMSLALGYEELHDAVDILELKGDPVGFELFEKKVEGFTCFPKNLALCRAIKLASVRGKVASPSRRRYSRSWWKVSTRSRRAGARRPSSRRRGGSRSSAAAPTEFRWWPTPRRPTTASGVLLTAPGSSRSQTSTATRPADSRRGGQRQEPVAHHIVRRGWSYSRVPGRRAR